MQTKQTALYEIHRQLGAKMVEFAGYWMPIYYRGILEEHRRVRTTVGVFDVSHMGEFFFSGPEAASFLQWVTINDVHKLSVYQAQYSAMCYEHGGLVDDLILYRFPDRYLMVVNAANIQKDWDWLEAHRRPGVTMENRSDELSLLAVQGRYAEATLQKLTDVDLHHIKYYWFVEAKVAGVQAIVSRTGYTGEDGFEVCVSNEDAPRVWEAIFDAGREFEIEPIGLGARDTLRLEMKYCLYGNDIDQNTNPIEAGLGWITKMNKGDFIGRAALEQVLQNGPSRKLVGLEVEGKAFPRHGYPILDESGAEQVGFVTSGT
ncbi:MAG: glycine cleavage system aminomethyltransferase GcvT, partial [candidate division KSB1 bacterium]|nr:glycine cleavage system aminomethyltransferase GcvT [candidate division KSB1 bacterium]